MTAATKITLAYLFLAALWIFGLDGVSATLSPLPAESVDRYKFWLFPFLAVALIRVLLCRETARRDAVETDLRALVIRDSLTGLSNRTCFMEHLEKSIARAAREGKTVGVAFIDLDGFKAVNDRFGHQAGDLLLIEIARRVNRVVRSSDVVARLGGDEFVILAQDEQVKGMRRLGERLARALRKPFLLMGEEIAVTASVGLALYPNHGLRAEHLLRAADLAMYQVKATGKNGIRGAVAASAAFQSAAA
ncbi:GGDEF domain-containing protein [Telmatospirillum siberiense]|uniref:GGDEF domain-containing protein n=1 Tax=Telmatospirillum siberiense TaxID=382514 RepID=A0A2N3PWR1_9PROT|nr:GGDEF domain-containing protein [Telmatospirillum siberiense]PKU24821.1 hypothetical protein CWS72_09550 [Telmatospirillum siberiense]